MTNRTTREHLEQLVSLINKATHNRHDFSIGKAYGGYRLERKHQSVDVSPRLAAGELRQWMNAYLDGIDMAHMTNATRPEYDGDITPFRTT